MKDYLDTMAAQGKAADRLSKSLTDLADLADLAREWEKNPATFHCGHVLSIRLAELGFFPPVYADLDPA